MQTFWLSQILFFTDSTATRTHIDFSHFPLQSFYSLCKYIRVDDPTTYRMIKIYDDYIHNCEEDSFMYRLRFALSLLQKEFEDLSTLNDSKTVLVFRESFVTQSEAKKDSISDTEKISFSISITMHKEDSLEHYELTKGLLSFRKAIEICKPAM